MKRDEQLKEAAIARYGSDGNESQYMLAKIQAFMVGGRYADEHPNGSIIKWKTGKPKEGGYYLITTDSGRITTDLWRIFPNRSSWEYRDKFDVKAWCKLSDIEPYIEKTR